jgi:hypothetical protein
MSSSNDLSQNGPEADEKADGFEFGQIIRLYQRGNMTIWSLDFSIPLACYSISQGFELGDVVKIRRDHDNIVIIQAVADEDDLSEFQKANLIFRRTPLSGPPNNIAHRS